jgi:hypothetical protein
MELSEYEKQRAEYIKRNQEMLAKLKVAIPCCAIFISPLLSLRKSVFLPARLRLLYLSFSPPSSSLLR